MKMDKMMIIVCSVVGSLGVLSAILGFSAEGTKLTISDVYVGLGVCYYPENSALALGVCAAIFLIVAQVIFAALGGCCGCCKSRAIPSNTKRIIGVICAIFSWISAMVAFGMLVVGAAFNATGTRDSSALGLCDVLPGGIFAGGAVLALVATALGITSYVLLLSQPAAAAAADADAAVPKAGEQVPAGAAGIATGQPQFSQQAPPQGQQGYPQYPPPPVPGYGAPAAPNQQYPPPAHVHGAQAPDQQFPTAPPPPAAEYYGGPHGPNQQAPPPRGHEEV